MRGTGFVRWHTNRPSAGNTENCVLIHRTLTSLHDNPCSVADAFICERELWWSGPMNLKSSQVLVVFETSSDIIILFLRFYCACARHAVYHCTVSINWSNIQFLTLTLACLLSSWFSGFICFYSFWGFFFELIWNNMQLKVYSSKCWFRGSLSVNEPLLERIFRNFDFYFNLSFLFGRPIFSITNSKIQTEEAHGVGYLRHLWYRI